MIPDPRAERSDSDATARWVEALAELEDELEATERLLLDVAAPQGSQPQTVAWQPGDLPALAGLSPGDAAVITAQATALLQRQHYLVSELAASLAMLRRHRDLIRTVSPPNDRPRYVDKRA